MGKFTEEIAARKASPLGVSPSDDWKDEVLKLLEKIETNTRKV